MDTEQLSNSNNDHLGKLRRVLKEPCPQCGSLLQLRSQSFPLMERGEEYTVRKDKIVCPKCLYERRPEKASKSQWKNHRKSRGGSIKIYC